MVVAAACDSASDFVSDGARAFEANVAVGDGVAGTLLASVAGEEDAIIVGEGVLTDTGRFTFSFEAVVASETVARQEPICPEMQERLLIVQALNVLRGSELLGDLVQATSAAHARGIGDGTRLLRVYSGQRLELEGRCSVARRSVAYQLELEQGWNTVALRTEGASRSYVSSSGRPDWYFVAAR